MITSTRRGVQDSDTGTIALAAGGGTGLGAAPSRHLQAQGAAMAIAHVDIEHPESVAWHNGRPGQPV